MLVAYHCISKTLWWLYSHHNRCFSTSYSWCQLGTHRFVHPQYVGHIMIHTTTTDLYKTLDGTICNTYCNYLLCPHLYSSSQLKSVYHNEHRWCTYLVVRPTESTGKQGIFSRGPQTFKGPHEAFISWFYLYGLYLHSLSLSFAFHCIVWINSTGERLGSNVFMVSVDKHFDACKHVKPVHE